MKKQIAAGVLSLSMILTPTISVWAQTPVVAAQDQTTESTNAKADQEAPAAAPELQEKTATSITLKPLSEGTTGKQAEYARVEGTADLVWQESNVFEGLTAATEYNFVARYKADANHNASPASLAATITTAKAEQAAPNVPECESKTATSITLKPLSEGTTGKQAEYARVEGTADLVWQESNVFEGLTAATEYNFVARYKADANHNASPASLAATITTAKAEQAAPNVPECESKTATSITLKPLSEGTTGKQAEYAMVGENGKYAWQESNVFSGLTPNTEYKFVARYVETDTLAASPASAELTVTTSKAEQQAPAAPELQERTATTVTLKPMSEGTTGKQAEYAMVVENGKYAWQESNVFSGLTPNTEYKFVARYVETDTLAASPASAELTVTTSKAEQQAPAAPELQERTATTVTLKPMSEGTTGKQAEYAMVGENGKFVWQASNVFSGLTPNTKYAFVVRYAATAELNASAASAPLEVTTAKRSTSYGGGGGAAVSDYVISIVKSEGGSLSVSQSSASAGTTITVTATADKGYKASAVTATDANGNKLSVKNAGNDKYTFIMPAGKVSVKASFVQEGVNTDAIIMQIGSKTIQAYGKTITNDAAPLIVNNRTMVPIRVVTETLGGTAVWNEAARTVTLVIDGKTITMTIDVTLEKYGVAPIIINNRTYVPIRFVAEELGADVQWNETTQQITITK